MFWTHPSEAAGFAIDDQLFVGSTGLLAKPVVEQGKESVDIWIPDDEVYYDYFNYNKLKTQRGKSITVEAPLERIPLLMRGGHIIPRRDTPRRSSTLMRFDDYTLVVSVSKKGTAEGELYADDGDSFDHEQGQYIHRKFELTDGALTSTDAQGRDPKSVKPKAWLKAMDEVYVDRIVIVGAPASWDKKEVEVESEGRTWAVQAQYHQAEQGRAAYVTVGRVGARIGADWSIKLN
jgi:alpha 1,3-glucosidase